MYFGYFGNVSLEKERGSLYEQILIPFNHERFVSSVIETDSAVLARNV